MFSLCWPERRAPDILGAVCTHVHVHVCQGVLGAGLGQGVSILLGLIRAPGGVIRVSGPV